MSRRFTVAAAVAVLFGCGVGIGGAPAAEVSCANATEIPTPATLAAANAAIVCLVNAERAKRGIPRLTVAKALTRAAAAHTADMLKRKYFSHISPAGTTPRRRIQRAGYLLKRTSAVNETLAVGIAAQASPAQLLKSLMDDGPHRRIVLSRAYRNIGVGLVIGYPSATPPDQSTTLTITYGRH